MVGVAGFLLASPAASLPQDPHRIYRIGLLTWAEAGNRAEAFKHEMALLGYKEGVNATFKFGAGELDMEATRRYAKEIVDWKPDVVVSFMSNSGIALKEATAGTDIPVVSWGSDLLGDQLIEDYRRSGNNFTGAGFEPYMQLLQIRFLKLTVPNLKCVAFFHNGNYGPADIALRRAKEAATYSNVKLIQYTVPSIADFDSALAKLKADGCNGLLVGPNPMFSRNFEKIGAFVVKHRIAAIGQVPSIVEMGGLAQYGPNPRFSQPWLARMADQILNGQKPGDIPTAHAFKNYTVMNVKAAKNIGLTIPPALLEEADVIVE